MLGWLSLKWARTLSRLNVTFVLGQQPGIGRPIDEMPDEFREWIIDFGEHGYVARYRLDSSGVTILAVRHQKELGD